MTSTPRLCACGCGRPAPATRRPDRPSLYATRGCTFRDPRRKRARHASTIAAAEQYASKADAYDAGYRAGYQLAYRWWKRFAQAGRKAAV